jgi:hypothetical protein
MRWSASAVLGIGVIAASLVACIGNIGDRTDGKAGDDGDVPGIETKGLEPAPPKLRRLLGRQYINSVRDLLGDGAASAAEPPGDTAINGFDSIGAAQLALGDDAVQKYETSARGVAAAAMGDGAKLATLLGCEPSGPTDAACHESFVSRFGRLAWRRPLAAEETAPYVALAQAAATEYGDFYAGVEWAIAGLLQSPNFLYQVEVGELIEGSIARKLDGYEVATRMSFFLLDTTPPEALLDAAEAGQLDDDDGVREMARELIAQPAARAALASFYSEVFALRDLDTLTKDSTEFPQYTSTLALAMREETLHLIDDIVWERDTSFSELFSADYTFVNAELAALYGIDAPAGSEFTRVDLPVEQQRAGFLGHASFLSLFAHVATTSPTLRGKFVRERVLCQSIPAPPNDVEFDLPSDEEAKTMREKMAAHQENPSCAGCHVLMDGIGLSFENFDPIGVHRTTENDVDIDATGEIPGMGSFDGVKELSELLATQPEVAACVVRNLYRHATGHVETDGEKPALDLLVQAFAASDNRMQELLVELVASEGFRLVGVEQ